MDFRILTPEVAMDRVLHRAAQVATEPAPLGLVPELSQVPGQVEHDHLAHVFGVGGLESTTVAVAQEEFPVARIELAPRGVVVEIANPR